MFNIASPATTIRRRRFWWRRAAVILLSACMLSTAVGIGAAELTSYAQTATGHTLLRTTPWGSILTSHLPLHTHLKGDPLLAISPNFSSDGTAVAGTPQGVYATSDGGTTWTCVGFCGISVVDMAMSQNFDNNNSQGAVLVALSCPAKPTAGCQNTLPALGYAQVWLLTNINGSNASWLPTRIYMGSIDALAINDQGMAFVDFTGSSWEEWVKGCGIDGCKPHLDMEGSGLYDSQNASGAWNIVTPTPYGAGCGLAFNLDGPGGWMIDDTGQFFNTADYGAHWSAVPWPRTLASSPVLPGADSGKQGYFGYVLDLFNQNSRGCNGPGGGELDQGVGLATQPLSLWDQHVTSLTADPNFTIPGHHRDIAFAATGRGIYLGGADSTGDFFDLLPGSPHNASSIAAGRDAAGQAVIMAMIGSSIERLNVNWPLLLPSLDFQVGSANSTTPQIYQGSTYTWPDTLTSKNGFSGKVDFRFLDSAPLSVAPPTAVKLATNSTIHSGFAIHAYSGGTPGTYLILPIAEASDESAYKSALGLQIQVVPPPVYLEKPSISPGSTTIARAGGNATFTVTISRGPQWTPAYSRVKLTLTGYSLPEGVATTFSPPVLDLSSTDSASSTLTVTTTQLSPSVAFQLGILATSASRTYHMQVTVTIGPPVPTTFIIAPSAPPSMYEYTVQHLTISALGENGRVLTNYSGPLAQLSGHPVGVGVGYGCPQSGCWIDFYHGIANVAYSFNSYSSSEHLIVTDESGAPSATTATFSVEAPPVAFKLSPISNQVIDHPFAVHIEALDAKGRLVTLYNSNQVWLADQSGFVYERIGPFSGGTWTGNITVPVLITHDLLRAGDPIGIAPLDIPVYGNSNLFDIQLPPNKGLGGGGTWPQVDFNAGRTDFNPTALVSASGLVDAKVLYELPTHLPTFCGNGFFGTLHCESLSTSPGGAGDERPPEVGGGIVIPGQFIAFNTLTGQFLWVDTSELSSGTTSNSPIEPIIDGNAIYACKVPQNLVPPSQPKGEGLPEGPESRSLTGNLLWGPLGSGRNYQAFEDTCRLAVASGGYIYGVTDYCTSWSSRNYCLHDIPALETISERSGTIEWNTPLPFCTNMQLTDLADCSMTVMASGHTAFVANPNSNGPLRIVAINNGSIQWDRSYVSYTSSSMGGNVQLVNTGFTRLATSGSSIYSLIQFRSSNGSPAFGTAVLSINAKDGNIQWITPIPWWSQVDQLVVTQNQVIIATDFSNFQASQGCSGLSQTASPRPTGSYAIPASWPWPPSGPGRSCPYRNGIAALNRRGGKIAWERIGLPTLPNNPQSSNLTGGGGILILQGQVFSAIDGRYYGSLPGDSPALCSSTAPTSGHGEAGAVAVASTMLYYRSCQGRYVALQWPATGILLELAEEAYAAAQGHPAINSLNMTFSGQNTQDAYGYQSAMTAAVTGFTAGRSNTKNHGRSSADTGTGSIPVVDTGPTTARAREAAIAAVLFQAAGDSAGASKARALAARLGWHPEPKAPPAAPRTPSWRTTMARVKTYLMSLPTSSRLPVLVGWIAGLLCLAATLVWSEQKSRRRTSVPG